MKKMEPLEEETHSTSSDDSSESDSDDDLDSTKSNSNAVESLKRKRGALDYNALSRHGYSGGLSVLKVPPPRPDDKEKDWSWSTGKEKDRAPVDESYEERERTRATVTSGEKLLHVPPTSSSQKDSMDKSKSFSQKEKRKRDLGQASRGKSYVEEEKRLLRESGVYSGFDS